MQQGKPFTYSGSLPNYISTSEDDRPQTKELESTIK